MATSASASSVDSIAPSNLRFKRAIVSVTPTSPGPGETFKEGATCTTEWTPGSGSNWKSMTISLMTGSNEDMTVLTSVAEGIDGTKLSTYSWTCPEVTPNSAIYFYQFTDKNSANPTWTTRFTIAGTDGSTTTPTNSEQASGQTVLWGTGKLLSSSSSNSGSSGSSSSGSTGSTTTSAASSPETTSYSIVNGATSTTAESSGTTSSSSDPSSSTSSSSAPQFTTSSSTTSSSSSTSGAASINVVRLASAGMAIVAVAALVVL